jgi:hypothetical protein
MQDEIIKVLDTPFHIRKFCENLERIQPSISDKEIKKEIKEITDEVNRIGKIPPRRWFDDLSPNAQFYAILSVLFNGLDRQTLDEVYSELSSHLRSKGLDVVKDPRGDIGILDILEEIQVQDTNFITFDSSRYKNELLRQIENKNIQLWTLVDILLDWIEKNKAPEHWEFRRALGNAIGHLGLHNRKNFRIILEKYLALHQSSGVVATIGYALEQFCINRPDQHRFVINLLKEWVESGDPNYMWATGVSIWRIYNSLIENMRSKTNLQSDYQMAADQLLDILTLLAKSYDQFSNKAIEKALTDIYDISITVEILKLEIPINIADELEKRLLEWGQNNAKSILHAAWWMISTNSKDIVELIIDWLNNKENQNLQIIGREVGFHLFESFSQPDTQIVSSVYLPLLELVYPLLSISNFSSNTTNNSGLSKKSSHRIVNTVVLALSRWAGDNEDVAERVYECLLYSANRIQGNTSSLFRKFLSDYWLKNQSSEIELMANKLLKRSFSVNGFPLLQLRKQYGIVAFDNSGDYRMHQRITRKALMIFNYYDGSILNMSAHPLGKSIILDCPNSIKDLRRDYSRACLVLPSIESADHLDISKSLFVIFLTFGRVLDLDDIDLETVGSRFIILSKDWGAISEKQDSIIFIDDGFSDFKFGDIDAVVRKLLVDSFIDHDPNTLWDIVEESLSIEKINFNDIASRLSDLAKDLDNWTFDKAAKLGMSREEHLYIFN